MKSDSPEVATPALPRRMVSAATIEKIEQLLAAGLQHNTIAAQCEVSRYIVWVVANDQNRPRKAPRRRSRRKQEALCERYQLDAVDVRRIQRMLAVGMLNAEEIGREVGVGADTVLRIANGQRPPITLLSVPLCDGEEFLPVPIRCQGCGGLVSVTPCRLCAARARTCVTGRSAAG